MNAEDVASFPLPGTSSPLSLAFSPDDNILSYLHAEGGQMARQLWGVDLATFAKRQLIVPPNDGDTEENLSLEERLRRERQRMHAVGVTSYYWSGRGSKANIIIVPLQGNIYVQNGNDAAGLKVLYDKGDGGGALDPQLSPDGRLVAFVRDRELFVMAVAAARSISGSGGIGVGGGGGETGGGGGGGGACPRPVQVTFGACEGVTHGLADFIAQEEMDRYRGFWWSTDSQSIAFAEVDERHVPAFRIMHSGKPGVDDSTQEDHRYPFAGKANPKVRLGIIAINGLAFEYDSGHLAHSSEMFHPVWSDTRLEDPLTPPPPVAEADGKGSGSGGACTREGGGSGGTGAASSTDGGGDGDAAKGGEAEDEEEPKDCYLARVNWWPDGSVCAQVQNRPQTRLQLQRVDAATGARTVLVDERSHVWINLHHLLRCLSTPVAPPPHLWPAPPSSTAAAAPAAVLSAGAGAGAPAGQGAGADGAGAPPFAMAPPPLPSPSPPPLLGDPAMMDVTGAEDVMDFSSRGWGPAPAAAATAVVAPAAGASAGPNAVAEQEGGDSGAAASSAVEGAAAAASDGDSMDVALPEGSFSFLWASERTGFMHLYLYTYLAGTAEATLVRAVTAGDWVVESIVGVDQVKDVVYVMGTYDGACERHLYAVPLLGTGGAAAGATGVPWNIVAAPLAARMPTPAAAEAAPASAASPPAQPQPLPPPPPSMPPSAPPVTPVRLSAEAGMHNVIMDHRLKRFVDVHSTLERPAKMVVYQLGERPADPPVLLQELHYAMDDRVKALRARLRPPEVATLRSRDGAADLFAAVYRPDPSVHGPGPYPTVVAVYGGPHVQRVSLSWGTTVDMRAQWLRDLGFCVLKVDNRGSFRRGLAFEGWIKHCMGSVEVLDQEDAVRWLVGRGLADPARVGMYGWSYGGYLTAMSLCKAPQTFRVGVAGAPVTSWDGYDTHYTERYMGLPAHNAAGYRDASVLTHAARLQAKLVLVHG
ncbi:unnamed protein product, partial [Phaeothamnion confervicola]